MDIARWCARIDSLIAQAMPVMAGQHLLGDKVPFAAGWFVAVDHIVSQICRPGTAYYRALCDRRPGVSGTIALIAEMLSVLARLQEDIKAGLIASLAEQARAEALDDLLEQAAAYHKKGNIHGSAVLVAAVFEDAIRNMARIRNLEENGKNLDSLISGLEAEGACSAVASRRWKAVAALRNKALHAHWDEFTHQDVGAAIELVREIVEVPLTTPAA